LFLYQFLKYFPGDQEIWGAIVIPSVVMGIFFLMPFISRGKAGHRVNVMVIGATFVGAGILTCLALATDARDDGYQAAVKQASREAERAKELARSPGGIPATGAAALLRADPMIQGAKLFAKNCASCHRFEGHDGLGIVSKEKQSASDLAGFGSQAWLTGLLDPARVSSTNYFGATKFKDGKMSKFVKKDVAAYTPEEQEQLRKVIEAVSAEAQLKSQAATDKRDEAIIAEGRKLVKDAMACTECHQFREKDADATAPDLTGYGSREWLIKILDNPAHDDFYGKRNDRMPAFGEKQVLTPEAIGLIADWLRKDWYEPVTAQQAMGK
jgi:ubiquinol-cytochrome c reductase cytochrome b subunit